MELHLANASSVKEETFLQQLQIQRNYFKSVFQADKAVQEYIRCMALARIVFGSNHWRYAESIVDLAETYFDLKGLLQAFIYRTAL